METSVTRLSRSSEILGRPSGNRSPSHLAVKNIIWSWVCRTCAIAGVVRVSATKPSIAGFSFLNMGVSSRMRLDDAVTDGLAGRHDHLVRRVRRHKNIVARMQAEALAALDAVAADLAGRDSLGIFNRAAQNQVGFAVQDIHVIFPAGMFLALPGLGTD